MRLYITGRSHDNSIDIVTVLQAGQLKNFVLISVRGEKLFLYVKCPDWLWVIHSFLSSGYMG
jgi:hypothetical protein